MPRWERKQKKARKEYCPVCKSGHEEIQQHVKTEHQNIVQLGDIFWNGPKEAFYSGRYYQSANTESTAFERMGYSYNP